ncbi:MAG: tetratricopeptide repeat protein [Candidatus Zixiibacteriota bacterium]
MKRNRISMTPPHDSLEHLPPDLRSRLKADPDDLSAALDAAEHCARHGLETAIPEILCSFHPDSPTLDSVQRDRIRLLLACGHVAARRYDRAEQLIAIAADRAEVGSDWLYLSSQVAYAMREYERVIPIARDFLDRTRKGEAGPLPTGLFVDATYRSRAYVWLGESYLQLQRDEEAIEAFRRAANLDSSSVPAHVGLVRALVRQGRRDEAAEVVDRGLERCHDMQELTMLRDYLLIRPTISACMIVRNEEQLLAGCLESIRDWVDEIIVVDTGSTDRTIEIACQYGAKVLEQPWADDFSAHRNSSIEQATSEWVLIIDADERMTLEDVPLLIDTMRSGHADLVSVGVYNVYGENHERVTFANSIRMFKRESQLRYSRIVHNELVLPAGSRVVRTNARLTHLGYDLPPDKMKAKFERSKRLLQKQLNENPNDIFALFNYAELLRGVEPEVSPENAGEIIAAAEKVIGLVPERDTGRRHLRLMALNQLAAVYLSLKNYPRALEFCRKALEVRPGYLDGLIHLGLIHYRLRDFRSAIAAFECYLEAQAKFDNSTEVMPIILSFPDARDLAYNNLGALYELTGDPIKARQCYLKAIGINPRYRETASRLARLHESQGDWDEAEHWYRHQLQNRPTAEALVGLASLYFEMGRYALAESQYLQAVEQHGETSALRNDLGNCLYRQNRFAEAEEHYRLALDLTPLEPLAYRNLALAHLRQDRKPQAADALNHYMEHCPGDAAGWRLLADLWSDLGEVSRALTCYESLLRLTPGDTQVLLRLSDCYLVMGHSEAAVLGYRHVLSVDPRNAVAHQKLAELTDPGARS